MAHEEPISQFRSLDKVRILLRGTQYLVAYNGTCASLKSFDELKGWHYIDFGINPVHAIIIHDVQPDAILFDSGRRGRKARLFYSQAIVYWNGWTLSLPEYHLEKINSPYRWDGIKRIMDSLCKLSRRFKIS